MSKIFNEWYSKMMDQKLRKNIAFPCDVPTEDI
jgi:hypothetical protein